MRALLLSILIALPAAAQAGKFDIDYYRPSPTKAFMWSAAVPGGGMLYLSDYDRDGRIVRSALAFMAIEGALLLLAKNRADKRESLMLPLGALFVVKIFEFDFSIDKAERLRHTRYMMDEMKEESYAKDKRGVP